MIELRDVTKCFRTREGPRYILRDASATFPAGQAIAVLGRNGIGKSTLLKMIGGALPPDRGRILRTGSVSWPIGFAGSFHPDLTGAQNTAFLARVYGRDTDALRAFVQDFSELGSFFDMPFRTYSSGMRARLAFAVSMGVPFDWYLVDEVTSVGDSAFRAKCDWILRERLRTSGALVVSHALGLVERLCDAAVVIDGGALVAFEDVSAAISHHRRLMARRSSNPAAPAA